MYINNNLKSIIMKKIVLLTSVVLFAYMASAQVRTVSGKVTGFHQYPFKNITVEAKKAKTKVLTDINGEFSIACYSDDILIFQSKSCLTAKRKIKNPDDSVKINLVFKTDKKSKEYAIGYGIISEENLTHAISNLNNSDTDFSIYSDIYELIRGKVPGVVITNSHDIIIRGSATIISSNAAYLVVDGIPVQNLSYLQPRDVKSIDVLKDASTTSSYGANGANGVILITTLKGGE
jgi:TonB-dependent SusC/RagA subfamily outer membrane receptor